MRQLLVLVVEFFANLEVVAVAQCLVTTAEHTMFRKQSLFFKASSEALVGDEDLIPLCQKIGVENTADLRGELVERAVQQSSFRAA